MRVNKYAHQTIASRMKKSTVLPIHCVIESLFINWFEASGFTFSSLLTQSISYILLKGILLWLIKFMSVFPLAIIEDKSCMKNPDHTKVVLTHKIMMIMPKNVSIITNAFMMLEYNLLFIY